MIKSSPCIQTGCYKRSTERGRCADHQLPAWESGRRSRLPDDWAELSRYILERDGRICHVCKAPGADGVDHLEAGDDHSPGNLAAIHHHAEPRCHVYKSSQEGNEAKRQQQSLAWGQFWANEYRRQQEHPSTRPPF